MHDFLKAMLNGQNQFASGGLLLMILGGVGVFLRSLPAKLWEFLTEQTTMTVTVKDDEAFRWAKEWFLEQNWMRRTRRMDLDTTLRGTDVALIPAPGMHWFLRGRRPFWVSFYRDENPKGYTRRRTESLTFRTIGRDQRIVRRLVDELVDCHRRKAKGASYLYVFDEGWELVEAYAPRLLESVLLKPGEKEHLLADMEHFRKSRDRYRRLGVPYHRGYLFWGPPGTGKTSLVSALAAQFGMNVYMINLAEMNDRILKRAMNGVPEDSVILFEDIDCMKSASRAALARSVTEAASKEADTGAGVSLSGLLNVLDGVHAPENVMYAMTTNDVEALDAALLRPGRIDYRLYMGEAAESQKVELYRRFFPAASHEEAQRFAEAHNTETMAAFQGVLLALEQEEESIAEICR